MKKLIMAICVALFALSGTAAYAADEKKAEPAKTTTAKAAAKPASAPRLPRRRPLRPRRRKRRAVADPRQGPP